MESVHLLKTLLQLQLATDSSAVLHLPYVLASLTNESFVPSPHLPKWTARITSLLHSKDAGSRWAGLCLAHRTSVFSRDVMVECSHNWLGIALPMLSKNEPIPALKAAIRLLRIIFNAGIEIPEFQRQVATPNVSKFTAAVIGLAEKHNDADLMILALTTLARLIPLYPTLSRMSHAALSALSLRFLNGSIPNPTSGAVVEAASRLYAVLHFTGGKVGASNLWRKSVDETVAFGWSAFLTLRTTFVSEDRNSLRLPMSPNNEPLTTIPLNIDRLRCCIAVLCDLLNSTTYRPVQLPLGSLVKFATTLLSCTRYDEREGHLDSTVRTMEVSVIPAIWKLSCDLISCLAKCARHHLSPHLTQLVSYLTFHLEQKPTSFQRFFMLKTLQGLPLDSSLIPTRLAKAILPSISIVLNTSSRLHHTEDPMTSSNKSRKSKKRARGYEGDEIFQLSREVICPNTDDGQALLAAFEVMQLLLQNPNLSPAVQSLSSRLLLSVFLELPQISPASLSQDLSLHRNLLRLVQGICIELGSGTTSVMSKSLGLVISAAMKNGSSDASRRRLDILLHPRVPPLVRSLPHVESLSLFRAEEPQDELELREALGATAVHPDRSCPNQDSTMKKELTRAPPPKTKLSLSLEAPPAMIPTASLNTSSTLLNNHPQQATFISSSPPSIALPPESLLVDAAITDTHPHPTTPQPHTTVAITDDEEDEVMPIIDLNSDSDVD